MEQNENYEFTSEQNVVVGGLAQKMKFVGIIEVIIGLFYLITALVNKSNIINGVINILIGVWTINASKSFQLVVDTQGNDIQNLMDALGQLKKLFSFQYWAYITAIVIVGAVVLILVALGQTKELLKLVQ